MRQRRLSGGWGIRGRPARIPTGIVRRPRSGATWYSFDAPFNPGTFPLARDGLPCSLPSMNDVWLRGLPLAVLTVSLIAVPVLVLEPQGMPRMRALDKELKGVEAENAELRREVARLRTEVKDLRENPAAVERIAREQLGLVRKSEVVFQFDKK